MPYFAKSRNLEALADCYTCLGEFGNLELVLDELCDASRAGGDATTQNKNLLRKTATAFAAVGMCDAATRAFVAAGDPAAAIATCVAMNRWATAVALAERHEVGEKALPLKALQVRPFHPIQRWFFFLEDGCLDKTVCGLCINRPIQDT